MSISQAIAERTKEILKERGKTVYWLETSTGMSRGTLYSLVYNRHSGVNLNTVTIIVQALGVTLTDFFKSPLFSKENIELGVLK